MNLDDTVASAWAELEAATVNLQSGFRYVNLCSVDASGRPQARMVVLRRIERTRRLLEVHTDTRSAKWQEISQHASVTILGFCARTKLQLRLQGMVERHGPGSERADKAWAELSPWTRSTYAGGPPGDEVHVGAIPKSMAANAIADSDGKAFFGVLSFRAEALDWFELRHADNRRALFTYDELGALTDQRWVNP
ncbi:pyridoxamine 5'-phosphate oxidase family protein [Sinorhizobium sp. RAC02]|uniref:pyridoxamine 5'-phosphate oxidase family protein n=1 Tax=Sinorhizobium sp. RAC02 TaxID=1842534 RepID=UPI00083CBD3D|nr:pyridoxamine 5'-phosphate oxidase family protein [Sinorhizobium sp. RAC02]AOF93292.1 pyridoxamine 5'-phosphate oxidase family protein [Sinorhizobium sp. RAC02]